MQEGVKKILVIGQIPPPYGGQAVMIDTILKGKYTKIKLFHVRMLFSKEMDEVGKPKASKVFHLMAIVWKSILYKFRYNIKILYFPVTGPNKLPFYRDAIFLVCVRPFFKKVCLHFHGAGISELYPQLGALGKFMFRRAYYYGDLGIRLSAHSSDDGTLLRVKREVIVPYGIEDHYPRIKISGKPNDLCTILYVALLNETKGVLILMDTCRVLKSMGVHFRMKVMGKFESVEFEKKVRNKVVECGLDNYVTFLGVMAGDHKFEVYANSDIFCFPSFFEAESFPVVLLEASSFALPIVSTQWRGIPSIVIEGQNGFLAPIRDSDTVAEKLRLLIDNPELRKKMGTASRRMYLEKYSLQRFYENIESALFSIDMG